VASVSLSWNKDLGFDIHLLKNETSASLLALLVINEDDGKAHFASTPPPDIDPASIRFEPNFASLVTPPKNAGITVDTSTGVVSVANRPAPPRLERFVIEATVMTKPPSPKTLGPLPIRVHVHDSIDELWLTPSTLTVRRGTTGTRFTVLARFDDRTIGDVTGRAGIEWSHDDPGSPGDPRIRVNNQGELAASADAATVTITAKHAGRTATAIAASQPRWSEQLDAVLIRTHSAGIDRMAEVPNVLFLAEGFQLSERAAYEDLVRQIVDQVQDPASQLRPFDLFRGVINYWIAFVPSRARGTSPLYDMNVVQGQTLRGEEIPLPERPTPGSQFTLENLIYAVGLPAPSDATATLQQKTVQWLVQYGPSVSFNVTAPVFAAWQRLHDHRLANEVDSAFGVAMGSRPRMHPVTVHRSPGLNTRRVTAEHLQDLFVNMRCQTASFGKSRFGSIWADPKGTAVFEAGLPPGLKGGQDRGLAFFVLGGARAGGSQPNYGILGSLVENVEVDLAPVTNSRRVDIVPHALPATPPLRAVARVAHEVSHALGLLDEYGEFPALTIPDNETAELDPIGNVQPAKELATSAADPRLDPAKLIHIKWLWSRIAAAGVLTGQPTPATGGAFVVRMRKGHAAEFKKGDVVRLRKQGLIPRPAESVRLSVTRRPSMANDEVTVRPLAATPPFVPADWQAGSLLIRPERGDKTQADPLGPDLKLVSPVILDHLAQTRLPLNRPPPAGGQPAPVCVEDRAHVQTPSATVRPSGRRLKRPTSTQHIVGVYDAGARYFCGVFHPAGECLMRQLTVTGQVPPQVYPFCWVCAYFLVDLYDPTKHALIERGFKRRYPRL
jgi:hypothetical protein